MPVNGKPNGRFELPPFKSFDFNLTDGTDIPPPLPDSPIEEEPPKTTPALVPASASAASISASAPQTNGPVRSTSTITPPASASASANSQSDFAHLTATKSNGFSNLTTTKSNGYFPPTATSPRNNGPVVRVRAPSDAAVPNSPNRPEKESSIRKFLSRKSPNHRYSYGNKSHEDLLKMVRPESPISLASSRPSFVKRKSGSWFRSFGSSSKRNSLVFEDKPVVYTPTLQSSPELQKENTQPMYTKPMYTKPGPPPPKLPELNQLKAKIADDDRGSLGGDEMFRNIS